MDIKDLKKKYDFSKIPKNLKISTLSACCKLNITIYLQNIFDYMDLDNNNINTIKYCNKINSIINITVKKKKKKNANKVFFNQLTMLIYSNYSKKNINLKLFKNGSIQMSGCKSIEDCIDVINKLKEKLSKIYARIENNKIVEKPFIEENKELLISDFKIILINSNFKIPYSIKREELYRILLEDKINCRYEPCIHACVNIKYNDNEDVNMKPVSIFVFQSGNIIITGAKETDRILNAYNYIRGILTKNIRDIIRKDIDVLKS